MILKGLVKTQQKCGLTLYLVGFFRNNILVINISVKNGGQINFFLFHKLQRFGIFHFAGSSTSCRLSILTILFFNFTKITIHTRLTHLYE